MYLRDTTRAQQDWSLSITDDATEFVLLVFCLRKGNPEYDDRIVAHVVDLFLMHSLHEKYHQKKVQPET